MMNDKGMISDNDKSYGTRSGRPISFFVINFIHRILFPRAKRLLCYIARVYFDLLQPRLGEGVGGKAIKMEKFSFFSAYEPSCPSDRLYFRFL